jgi:hypothetical protein
MSAQPAFAPVNPLAGTATFADALAEYERWGILYDGVHPETMPECTALLDAAERLCRAWRHYAEGDDWYLTSMDTPQRAAEHMLSVGAEILEHRAQSAA